MVGVNSKSRRDSFQLPDRCRHLTGSFFMQRLERGKVFKVILHSTYLKFSLNLSENPMFTRNKKPFVEKWAYK